MQTDFNKNIFDFKDNFWKGLTKRQFIWGGIGFGGGMAIMGVSEFVLHQTWGQLVGAFLAVICGFIGFFERDGLKGEDLIFLMIRSARTPKVLICKDRYEPPIMYKQGGFHTIEDKEEEEEPSDDESDSDEIENETEEPSDV